jgi:hypothetical protein
MADRAARGAEGERKVGAILEGLGPDWQVLHGVWLGHGDIDHVLVGPGGTFTVETKSHGGPIPVDQIEERMLRQAYAESKVLKKVSGLDAIPLLVATASPSSPPGCSPASWNAAGRSSTPPR